MSIFVNKDYFLKSILAFRPIICERGIKLVKAVAALLVDEVAGVPVLNEPEPSELDI